MARNTFATFGILAVLLMSLGMVSADVAENGISISLSPTSISNASTGDAFSVVATIENLNGTGLYIDFRTTNWDSWDVGADVANGTSSNFTGVFTVPSSHPASRGVYADVYNASNHSQLLFGVDKSIALSYYTAPVVPSSDITFCEIEGYADKGDLEISDFDINNLGEGKNDEWQYLDEIEIEIEIENTNNDDDVDDVEVELRIYDNKKELGGNDVTSDFELEDEVLDDIGKLKDDDKETLTFVIKELPSDVEDGIYYMYIMAYDDGNEGNQCISESTKIDDIHYFQFTVEPVDDDEAVVARGLGLDAIIDTYCNQKNLEISVPIYNLGDNDEEKVLVNIYNSELGINEYAVINDLDSGDNDEAQFFVNIPLSLDKERYDLGITVFFDWDDDEEADSIYAYDESTSDETARLNVLGCKPLAPSVNANLESVAEVGTNLIVKAVVTNNGEDNDFLISAANFESWADLVSVTPQTVSIDNGEFVEVMITLSPKVAGAQSFKIKSIIDGESYEQSVSVNIAEDSGLFAGMNNVLAYIIIGIIAVLVLIFLVLVARVSRRREKPQF